MSFAGPDILHFLLSLKLYLNFKFLNLIANP